MKKHINKILIASQKIRKQWILCFLLAVGFIVACQGALEEGNPFGPSNSNIVIVESSPSILKGGTQTFTAIGGTQPLTWKLSAASAGQTTQIGDMGDGANANVFTAKAADPGPQVAGTATVTVIDAVGDTDTATITVLPNPLIINPGSSTQQGAGTEEFTVTGGSGVVVATYISLLKQTTGTEYTTPGLSGLNVNNNVVTANLAAVPQNEGDQTWTITITDTENGDVGSVVLTLLDAN